jgi:hypothetical protein
LVFPFLNDVTDKKDLVETLKRGMQDVFLWNKNSCAFRRDFSSNDEKLDSAKANKGKTMRPKTTDQDKLEHGVRVRLTGMEKRLLVKRSREEGYRTLSDFCRAKLIKRREIKKIEVSKEFVMITKKLDYDLNKIGVNLNQVAKAINSSQIYQLNKADQVIFQQLLQELRNCFSVLQNYMDKIE